MLLVLTLLTAAALGCSLGAPQTRTVQPTVIPALGGGDGDIATTTLQPTPTQLGGCTPRTDWPTITVLPGDSLFGIAQATGATLDDLVTANCLANADMITAGQTLYVPNAPTSYSGAGSSGQSGGSVYAPPASGGSASCGQGYNWFFSFRANFSEPSCPGPLTTTSAVGQNFQGGRVYRYAPSAGDAQATIYVIFNDGTWTTFPDTWDQGQPNDDPNIVPPAGWYKPYGAIGKLWREQPGMRDKLGWAYQPESSFTGRIQAPVNDSGYYYVAHGLRNLALRLYTSSNRWEVVGTYP